MPLRDARTGQPLLTETQAGARLFGANVYPLDLQQSRAQNVQTMTRELRDIQRRMRQVLFDRNLRPAEREAERQTYLQHYREKAKEYRSTPRKP